MFWEWLLLSNLSMTQSFNGSFQDGYICRSDTAWCQEVTVEGDTGKVRFSAGLWQFAENAVGAVCENVRFQLFRTDSFVTYQSFKIPKGGCYVL